MAEARVPNAVLDPAPVRPQPNMDAPAGDEIDLLAYVIQRLVDVVTGLELEHHAGAALIGVGPELLQPLDGADLLLHRSRQQAFGIVRRDALQRHHHVDEGQLDVL